MVPKLYGDLSALGEHLSIRNRIMTVPGQWCRFQIIPASCERGLKYHIYFNLSSWVKAYLMINQVAITSNLDMYMFTKEPKRLLKV